MPISNEIFETFRIQERVQEQKKAIKLLVAQGYTILDLENNIINKETTNIVDTRFYNKCKTSS